MKICCMVILDFISIMYKSKQQNVSVAHPIDNFGHMCTLLDSYLQSSAERNYVRLEAMKNTKKLGIKFKAFEGNSVVYTIQFF